MNNSILTTVKIGLSSELSVNYSMGIDDNGESFISINKVSVYSTEQIRDVKRKFENLNYYTGYWKRFSMVEIQELMWSNERDEKEFEFLHTWDFSKTETIDLKDLEKPRMILETALNQSIEEVENAVRIISNWLIDGHEMDVTDLIDESKIEELIKYQREEGL